MLHFGSLRSSSHTTSATCAKKRQLEAMHLGLFPNPEHDEPNPLAFSGVCPKMGDPQTMADFVRKMMIDRLTSTNHWVWGGFSFSRSGRRLATIGFVAEQYVQFPGRGRAMMCNPGRELYSLENRSNCNIFWPRHQEFRFVDSGCWFRRGHIKLPFVWLINAGVTPNNEEIGVFLMRIPQIVTGW